MSKRRWLYFGLLVCVFLPTLMALASLALRSSFHSHVLLIPFISAYLVWLRQRELGAVAEVSAKEGRCPLSSVILGCAGLVIAIAAIALRHRLGVVDALALQTAAFVCWVVAGLAWFQGGVFVRRHVFAMAFLVFMIPMPPVVEHGLEVFFQNASADAAYWMYQLTGTTMVRTGRTFELAGLTIEVAQECSGIRSSYVLFIVSLLGGHLLLSNPWSRSFLTLFVIPLGILRNGFRILTISLLTIHWDPGVIHGPLHHRGGPIFFAISLIPLFGLLALLRWWEAASGRGRRETGGRTEER